MKCVRWVLGLLVMGLLLATAACGGSKEPAIETPAAKMNLAAADIGPDWALLEEKGLAETPELKLPQIRDANMRSFEAEGITGMVMSYVFSTKTVASAEKEMANGDITSNFMKGVQSQVPDMTFETTQPPDIGDEAVMIGGTYADLDLNVSMLTFRKGNVIVMLAAAGPEEVASEEAVSGYAQTVEARIR